MLGCGTLILIALIVMFFSQPGLDDMEKEIRGLRTDVSQLKTAVETQTGQIQALRAKLEGRED